MKLLLNSNNEAGIAPIELAAVSHTREIVCAYCRKVSAKDQSDSSFRDTLDRSVVRKADPHTIKTAK